MIDTIEDEHEDEIERLKWLESSQSSASSQPKSCERKLCSDVGGSPHGRSLGVKSSLKISERVDKLI